MYGLETFTAGGQRILAPTDRCIRVFYATQIVGSGSAHIPGFDGSASGFFVLSSPIRETTADFNMYIRMSGSSLEWKGVENATRVIFFHYR